MLYLKALHIIFVVTWFAGLFYIVRLFIYHTEANAEEEPKRTILQDQFRIMMKRLWFGITWPSALLTAIFGVSLVQTMQWWSMPFIHLKLAFVFFLYIYHFLCHKLYQQFMAGKFKYSSNQLRIWNEIATLFLVAIVFIIVFKDLTNWIYGLVGLVAFSVALMLAIRIYKRLREQKQ